MSAYTDNLVLARDRAATKLAAIMADPKPSYNSDGQSVDHTEFVQMLTDAIDRLNKLIDRGDTQDGASGIVVSTVVPI